MPVPGVACPAGSAPGAAKWGHLQRWGPTCSATATCPCKQAGDYKGDAGSFPVPGLHAIRVLTLPRGAKTPGSPVPSPLGTGDPGVFTPRGGQAMLQAWGSAVPIRPHQRGCRSQHTA